MPGGSLHHYCIRCFHAVEKLWMGDGIEPSRKEPKPKAQPTVPPSNPMLDWLWGGLNYQIEHHLFPTMPRHNLKKMFSHDPSSPVFSDFRSSLFLLLLPVRSLIKTFSHGESWTKSG
uniref:Fatty acid desaturase domain-containing protein n=1 Tax=Meloidogyne incognita TaxID=6306 RepID=A0A914MK60_MELIC